ncbi:MAG TPA: hypothetical protein VK840_00290, partial [Candidatus Dormibacteraeota bacterium]|nr:hypothetical protein [Candidatus Dormibacteraeota bacterium]
EKFGKHLLGRLPFAPISRFESASPATGSSHAHKQEQENLVRRAFGEAETKFHENKNNKQQEK